MYVAQVSDNNRIQRVSILGKTISVSFHCTTAAQQNTAMIKAAETSSLFLDIYKPIWMQANNKKTRTVRQFSRDQIVRENGIGTVH